MMRAVDAADSPNRRLATIEGLRRIFLLGSWIIAVALHYNNYHEPYFQLRMPSERVAEQAPFANRSDSLLDTESMERNRQSIERVLLDGPEADAFIRRVRAAFETARTPPDLADGASGIGSRLFSLYIRGTDPLLARAKGDRLIDSSFEIASSKAPEQRLHVFASSRKEAALDQPSLHPASFFYPQRELAPWVFAAGLLAYLLLPWARPESHTLAMMRWRIVLGDVGTMLMFGFFFAAPIAINQSVWTATGPMLWFSAIFWLLAALGLWLAWWTTYYASYRIRIRENGLSISTLRGNGVFHATNVARVERAELCYPKWLIWLMFITSFFGRGAAAAGQMGRTMIMASSKSEGWRIEDQSGRAFWVWLTDPIGSSLFANAKELDAWIRHLPVQPTAEAKKIRAAFPPDWVQPSVSA